MTAIKGKNIATTGSGHVAPGPPATSMAPPPPPPAPVFAPFLYVAKSSSGKQVSQQITCGGDPVLVKGSTMDIELPGNKPSDPTPVKDVVTHAVNKTAKTTSGSRSVRGSDKEVCVTGDTVLLNLLTKEMEVHQSEGKFISGLSFVRAMNSRSDKHAAKVYVMAEPVAAATGEVVDRMVDLSIEGIIPVAFARTYGSRSAGERTPFGRGGFTHSHHRFVRREGEALILRQEDGRDVRFPAVPEGEPRISRVHKLELRVRPGGKSFEVFDYGLDRWSIFEPLDAEGPAYLRSIRDAFGNRVELVYEGGRLVKIVDPARRELRLTHDRKGHIVAVELWARDEMHARVGYEYDAEGRLAIAIDALGHAERYEYDGRHRMVEKTSKNGARWRYRYDPETGRCTKAWGDGGLHGFELSYDLVEGKTIAHGNPASRVLHWNAFGAVTREATYDGAWVEETEYDDDLLVVKTSNAAGDTFEYAYDARGHLVQETDPAGNVTRWEISDDLVVARVDPSDPHGVPQVHRFTYDAHRALVGWTLPSGLTYQLAYDGRGLLQGIYGPEGIIFRYELDEDGNIRKVMDALGAVTQFEPDALGRLVKKIDPAGLVFRYEWDACGRLVAITGPAGGRMAVTYDALGCPARIETPGGQATTQAYAGTGQLAQRTMADGSTWSFLYDVNETLRFIETPKKERHEIRRDRAGRAVEHTTIDGRVLRYQWGRNDRVRRIEAPDGTWQSFEYDAIGCLLVHDSPHGTRTFERDARGFVKKAVLEEPWGKVPMEIERDRLGRIVAMSLGAAVTRYDYDRWDRLVSRRLPDGVETRYHYDPAGRLLGVEHAGRKLLIVRDPAGRTVRHHLYHAGIDVVTRYGDNGLPAERSIIGRAVGPDGQPAARPLSMRAWKYDRNGLPAAVEDSIWGSRTYLVDADGRLTGVTSARRSEQYAFDASGFLAFAGDGRQDAGSGFGRRAGNVVVRAHGAQLFYDACGRRTRKVDAQGRETRYLWDTFNQLREVELPTGERLRFVYDAFGRRIRKEIVAAESDGVAAPEVRVVDFLWDWDTLAMEHERGGELRAYVFEPFSFAPLLEQHGDEVLLSVTDPLGTVKELAGGSSEIVWSADHSAYGEVTETKGAARGSSLRLAGQHHDVETSLAVTRYRYFDPTIARWLSPDPIGLAGGIDPCGFPRNPTTTSDPLGLAPCPGVGYVKFTVDSKGRVNGMTAVITKEMCASGLGSDASSSIIPPGWRTGSSDRAHIWANRMGGPGDWQENLFTLRPDLNQHDMRLAEARVFNAAQTGPVDYNVAIDFSNNGRPSSVTLTATQGGTPVVNEMF